MSTVKVDTVRLPAFLASALVNGDTSGLTCSCGTQDEVRSGHHSNCDFRWLAAALAYVAPGRIVDVARDADGNADEGSFSRYCDLPGWHLGAGMLDYVILYPEAP